MSTEQEIINYFRSPLKTEAYFVMLALADNTITLATRTAFASYEQASTYARGFPADKKAFVTKRV